MKVAIVLYLLVASLRLGTGQEFSRMWDPATSNKFFPEFQVLEKKEDLIGSGSDSYYNSHSNGHGGGHSGHGHHGHHGHGHGHGGYHHPRVQHIYHRYYPRKNRNLSYLLAGAAAGGGAVLAGAIASGAISLTGR